MSYTLVVDNKNLVGSGNNTYQYNFLQGNFNIPDGTEMMIANVQIPYSFYNITSAYGNNTLIFNWPTGSSTYANYTITIPDRFYTTTSLSNYLTQWMIGSGFIYIIQQLLKMIIIYHWYIIPINMIIKYYYFLYLHHCLLGMLCLLVIHLLPYLKIMAFRQLAELHISHYQNYQHLRQH